MTIEKLGECLCVYICIHASMHEYMYLQTDALRKLGRVFTQEVPENGTREILKKDHLRNKFLKSI